MLIFASYAQGYKAKILQLKVLERSPKTLAQATQYALVLEIMSVKGKVAADGPVKTRRTSHPARSRTGRYITGASGRSSALSVPLHPPPRIHKDTREKSSILRRSDSDRCDC